MKVTRNETLIEVPHLGSTLTAVHPFLQGTYFQLADQIDAKQLQRPTMAQTASLIHDAYKNPGDDEQISKQIKQIMKNNYFYAFNGLLYTPSGVLNEAAVRSNYNEDHYAAMDAVIENTRREFESKSEYLSAGIEMLAKGKKSMQLLDNFSGRWSFMKSLLEKLSDRGDYKLLK